MAHAATSDVPERPPPRPPRRRSLAARILLWALGIILLLVALVVLAAGLLNTGPGHAFLARELSGFRLSNGLRIRVGRIDGSIYGRMVLRDVTIDDLTGPFVTSPSMTIDWKPLPLVLSRRVVLNELSAGSLDVLRRPALKAAPPRPNQPLLPAINIRVGRFAIGDLILEAPVDGKRRRLALAGTADLLRGRARLELTARALATAQQAGGDRIAVRLDVEPSRNRLLLEAHVHGPSDGVIAGLLKIREPLSLDLAGRGTWKLWRGRIDARVGGRPLVAADLTEASGAYSARGQASPGLLVKGAAARLTDPAASFDFRWSMKQRVLQLDGGVNSPEMSLSLAGGVGLADSTLRNMHVDLRLARPQAVSPSLTGADLAARLVLDGPMAKPGVDYQLAARSLGFGKDALEDVKASGRVQLGTGSRLQLAIHGSAGRLVGPGKLAGVITDIRLDGKVAGAWTGAVKGRIDLRSRGVTLAADISGSTRTQRYQVAAKGRLEGAAVAALGLQGVLGGPADVSVDAAAARGGVVQVKSLQLTSPGLKVTRASGGLGPGGAISLQTQADSAKYGPITLDAGGTLKSPSVHLTAAHPTIGVPLTNLDVRLTRPGAAYQIVAAAGTPYGPLAADAAVTLAPGAMTIDLQRASVAGLNLAGRLARTPQGPFAGELSLHGDGLSGQLRLAAAGAVQQADLAVQAHQARLPLKPAIILASGQINARALLAPGAPSITGRADLTGVQRGGLQLAAVRADLQMRGGTGRAVVQVNGTQAQPFTLASTISMSPGVYIVDARGSARRLAFHLAQPARITRTAGAWTLAPATLVLPHGRLEASGSFGKGLGLSLRLEQVDLSMTQGFAPDLGLGGFASGTVDVSLPSGGAAPNGRVLLQLSGLTRSGLTTVSEPVDVNVLGSLGGAGADLSTVVRRRGVVVGRMQARVTPAAAGSSWLARFQGGSVTGGVRYDGPSEALWAISGISGQEISGPIAIGADVSGRVDAPQLRGVIHAHDLRYEYAKYGTRIDNLAIQGSFAGTRLQLTSLSGKAGSGTISASGYADLSIADGLPIDVHVSLNKAQLARSSDVSAALTGKMEITSNKAAGGVIAGALTVDNARYAVSRPGESQVVDLQGVHFKGQSLEAPASGGKALPISRWKLDVRVRADNQIFVTGMGLNSEWRADLRISGDIRQPVVVGDITSIRGTYSFAGRQLTLTSGIIHLDGSNPPNPTLAITASDTVNSVTATIDVGGTARDPQITFSSTPALPQDEVLSRLMFGAATPQLSPLQAVQLAASLNALRGGHGLNPLGKLRQAIGVQNLTITGGSGGAGPGIGVGKYISNRIYVQVTTDTRGFAATQVQVALTKALNLLSQVSSLGTSNLSLQYSHRY